MLDLTDPLHGAKSTILKAEGSLPDWFLPAVGLLRLTAAICNFSGRLHLVMGAQIAVSMVWCGAIFFHIRREHHPAAVLPASMFVFLACIVTALRLDSFLLALAGTIVCAVCAMGLGLIFVSKPGPKAVDLDRKRRK